MSLVTLPTELLEHINGHLRWSDSHALRSTARRFVILDTKPFPEHTVSTCRCYTKLVNQPPSDEIVTLDDLLKIESWMGYRWTPSTSTATNKPSKSAFRYNILACSRCIKLRPVDKFLTKYIGKPMARVKPMRMVLQDPKKRVCIDCCVKDKTLKVNKKTHFGAPDAVGLGQYGYLCSKDGCGAIGRVTPKNIDAKKKFCENCVEKKVKEDNEEWRCHCHQGGAHGHRLHVNYGRRYIK